MSRTCPNCRYVRQPGDTAPEWQCPSCEKTYNKAAGAPADARYGRYPVRETRDTGGSGTLKWGFVLAILLAGIWFNSPFGDSVSSLLDRNSAQGHEQPEVTLYSISRCGACVASRRFFAANDIRYTELNIEKSSSAAESFRQLGGTAVPLIVIGDDTLTGYDESRLRSLLKHWLKRS